MSKCSFACFDPPDTLEPYADIGGLGVIIGFLGTAWFVVGLVIVSYFFGFQSTKDPFPNQPDKDEQAHPEHVWVPNHIDQLVLRMSGWFSQTLLGRFENSELFTRLVERPRWERAFTKVLLGMCDVQLLTGTGILLSGYISLFCFISAYHWQLVVYLAWFSNLTHIASLTALRRYLHLHQLERNWRLFFMTVLWAGLIPAMVPTAFFNWPNFEPTACLPSSNARCFFDPDIGNALFNKTAYFSNINGSRSDGSDSGVWPVTMDMADTSALQSATVSILLLVFSYFTRTIKLIKRLSDSVRVTIRRRVSDGYTKRLASLINKIARNPRLSTVDRRAWTLVCVKVGAALYLEAKMYADLLTSDASDVYWLVVSAVWGTLRLTETKSSAEVDDNDWTFGQILPVFLLIGPIVTAIEALAPQKESEGGDDASNQGSARAGGSVGPDDGEVPVAQNNDAVQRQSDAASQHSVTQDSGLDAATTAWGGRSSTETGPAQLAGEAPTAQLEAQSEVGAHHSAAGNDAAGASQVGSEQAAPEDARTQGEMAQEQLLAQLESYYTDRNVMGRVVALACLQVLPVTVMIFNSIAVDKMNATNLIIRFMTNIFVVQPINSFLTVLWGLLVRTEVEVLVVDGSGSRHQRHRWWARWPTIRSGLAALLFTIDLFCLVWADTVIEVSISLGMLVASLGLDIWYVRRASQRVEGQTRAATFAVAEAGHELEDVA